MDKTNKTAVVIIPPEDVWPPIQAIRRKHDRHFRRWMPHVTMIYPFRPRSEFATVAQQFSRVCQSISPFEVTLATFNFFQRPQKRHTPIWLAPEPQETFIQLHTVLWQVVPDRDEVRRHEIEFVPHLSVGQAHGQEDLTKLLTDLQSTWTPIKFKVREVSLIWRNDPPDDVFRVGQRIRLGSRRDIPDCRTKRKEEQNKS